MEERGGRRDPADGAATARPDLAAATRTDLAAPPAPIRVSASLRGHHPSLASSPHASLGLQAAPTHAPFARQETLNDAAVSAVSAADDARPPRVERLFAPDAPPRPPRLSSSDDADAPAQTAPRLPEVTHL